MIEVVGKNDGKAAALRTPVCAQHPPRHGRKKTMIRPQSTVGSPCRRRGWSFVPHLVQAARERGSSWGRGEHPRPGGTAACVPGAACLPRCRETRWVLYSPAGSD